MTEPSRTKQVLLTKDDNRRQGAKCIPASHLHTILVARPEPKTIHSTGFQNISRLLRSRKHRYQERSVGLLENNCQGATAEATDSRDRVFAFLGLSYDRASFVRNPTYAWSEKTMCMEMTKTFFWSKKSLDIVFLARVTSIGRTELGLPMWCPSYLRLPPAPHVSALGSYISGHVERSRVGQSGNRWHATGDSMITRGVLRIEQDRFLVTSGIKICSIESLGPSTGTPMQPHRSSTLQGNIDKKLAIMAINHALIMYANEYSELSSTPHLLRYLFQFDNHDYNFAQVRELQPRFNRLLAWRIMNGDFMVERKA